MEKIGSDHPHRLRERLTVLFEDEGYLRSLLAAGGPGELGKALEEKGVALTEDEVGEFRKALARIGRRGGGLSGGDLKRDSDGPVTRAVIGAAVSSGATAAIAVGMSLFGSRW